jgi:Uri superfamily endonuclease
MDVAEPIAVSFGRFHGGEAIELEAGSYLYIGSAMGGMASRLLRHASRRDVRHPHPIMPALVAHFGRMAATAPKKLHWHIDYLLEKTAVSFTRAFLIYSSHRWEDEAAAFLQSASQCEPIAAGLGASDGQGSHLFYTTAPDWVFFQSWIETHGE